MGIINSTVGSTPLSTTTGPGSFHPYNSDYINSSTMPTAHTTSSTGGYGSAKFSDTKTYNISQDMAIIPKEYNRYVQKVHFSVKLPTSYAEDHVELVSIIHKFTTAFFAASNRNDIQLLPFTTDDNPIDDPDSLPNDLNDLKTIFHGVHVDKNFSNKYKLHAIFRLSSQD